MLHITRDTKRLIIVAILCLALILGGVAIYFLLQPKATCIDGIQNQNEEGVDCGGVCTDACIVPLTGEPIEVRETAWIGDTTGGFDALAVVYNPNISIGAQSFKYTFVLRDPSGRELFRSSGTSWILPRETKPLFAFGLSGAETPAQISFDISEVDWQNLTDFLEKPKINIVDRKYERISSGTGYSRAGGTLVNDSTFDFQSVLVRVILRDAANKPLAINQTEARTIAVGERREFSLVFPHAFPGEVTRVDIEVDADVFGSENFIKRYFPGGKYQNFGTRARAF